MLLGLVRSIRLKDAYFRKLECCYGGPEKLGWVHLKEKPDVHHPRWNPDLGGSPAALLDP